MLALVFGQAGCGGAVIGGVDFDAEHVEAEFVAGDGGASAAEVGVEDGPSWAGEGLQEPYVQGYGFLGGVDAFFR